MIKLPNILLQNGVEAGRETEVSLLPLQLAKLTDQSLMSVGTLFWPVSRSVGRAGQDGPGHLDFHMALGRLLLKGVGKWGADDRARGPELPTKAAHESCPCRTIEL